MIVDPGTLAGARPRARERRSARLPGRRQDATSIRSRARRARSARATPIAPAPRRSAGIPVEVGFFVFEFMGGSMGSVVGEKITRQFERALAQRAPGDHVLGVGRRAHAGGRAVADADGQDVGGARPAARGARAVHLGAAAPDDRRRGGVVRDARRRHHRRAQRADRLRRAARDRADDPPAAAAGLPALRVPARARHGRPDRARARSSRRRSRARCAGSSAAASRSAAPARSATTSAELPATD